MLKNIENLGTVLNKKEQKGIQGGQFCMIHCGSECYDNYTAESDLQACFQVCQRLSNENGGGF